MVSELGGGRRLSDIEVIMDVAGATRSSHTRRSVIPEHGRVDFLVLSSSFLEEGKLRCPCSRCSFVVSLIGEVSRLV